MERVVSDQDLPLEKLVPLVERPNAPRENRHDGQVVHPEVLWLHDEVLLFSEFFHTELVLRLGAEDHLDGNWTHVLEHFLRNPVPILVKLSRY